MLTIKLRNICQQLTFFTDVLAELSTVCIVFGSSLTTQNGGAFCLWLCVNYTFSPIDLICRWRMLDGVSRHALIEWSARPSNDSWSLSGCVLEQWKLWWSRLEFAARYWQTMLSDWTVDHKQTKLPYEHRSIPCQQDMW